MDTTNQNLPEATAKAYEKLLVPALFQEWAERIANADEIDNSKSILDVACGTGVLARAVKNKSTEGSINGLDPNPAMLAVAREIAPDINWHLGTAEEIPFSGDTFDTVLSQFGLMFFPSPKDGLQDMKRVLKTDGWMIVAVFDSIENFPAYKIMSGINEKMVSKPVGEALRAPFSMGNTYKIKSLFSDAGLNNIEITTQKGLAKFSDPRHMVLSDVEGWFPFAQIHLEKSTIEAIIHEAEIQLKPFTTSTGAVEFETSVHIIKAQKI